MGLRHRLDRRLQLVIRLLVNSLAILITAYLLPGVQLDGFLPALITAIVLGLINTFVKPVLVILTLPITILTLGLFLLVINAVVILLTSALVPGFYVNGFWWALLFSLVLSIVNWILHSIEAGVASRA